MNTELSRQLGRSGIQAGAMGLGCWAIGGPWWDEENKPRGLGEVDDEESIRAIHCAVDYGITFFDTADVYGAGHSERILGKALRGRRDKAVISTKFGNEFDETTRRVKFNDDIVPSPHFIRQACEASLRRLETDHIDLYLLHIWSIPLRGVPTVLAALEGLVDDGLIRSYAWSTDLLDGARLFAQGQHCTAVQHELNVLQDAQEMLDLCEENDLASIDRSPLAMGLLSGKYGAGSRLPKDDIRGNEPEWMKYFKDGKPNPEWLKKLDAVREILMSDGRSLVQGALAWIWGRSGRTIPIPGFKTVGQVAENAAAMQFGPLNAGQMRAIDALLGR